MPVAAARAAWLGFGFGFGFGVGLGFGFGLGLGLGFGLELGLGLGLELLLGRPARAAQQRGVPVGGRVDAGGRVAGPASSRLDLTKGLLKG